MGVTAGDMEERQIFLYKIILCNSLLALSMPATSPCLVLKPLPPSVHPKGHITFIGRHRELIQLGSLSSSLL